MSDAGSAPASPVPVDVAASPAAADTIVAKEEEAVATKKKAAPRAKKEKAAAPAADAAAASSSSPASASASAGVSARGRERKVTSHFEPSAIKKSDEDLVIEAGPGTALGEIENVKRRMDATNALEVEMKALFHACFPGAKTGSQKNVIKKNIRQFSGYVKGAAKAQKAAATTKLETRDAHTLKLVCQILDIAESGSKAKLIENITEFLEKPVASGHAYKHGAPSSPKGSGKKRKTTKSSKKGKDGKDKVKRAPTSFILFSGEHRDQVRADNPELKITEVASKLGEMWRNLSDKKKAPYIAKAAKLKAAAAGEASGSEESGSDESEEEEEEEEKPKAKKAKTDKSASPKPALSDEWVGKFTSSINAILKGADLSALSIAKVREQLTKEHGELVVEANKDAIKQLILSLISKASAK